MHKHKELTINIADWRQSSRYLTECINYFIGEQSSGCIVVTLDGPMSGDEAVRLNRKNAHGVDFDG